MLKDSNKQAQTQVCKKLWNLYWHTKCGTECAGRDLQKNVQLN